MSEKRNNEINILKFIFSFVILSFHSRNLVPEELRNNGTVLFYNGNIAVEFFFIVSGFFFASSCFGGRYKKPQDFMLQKIKSFALPVWCSWGGAFVCQQMLKDNIRIGEIVKDIMKSLFEPLLLRNCGFVGKYFNGVTWYISALILSMALLVIPLYKYRDKYVYIVAPVIAFFLLGYLSHEYKSIRNATKWNIIMYKCQIRAIAEINLGIFVYGIKKWSDQIRLTRLGKWLFTIMEIMLYISIILFMHYGHISEIDFAVIILLAFAVWISMTQKTYFSDLADKIPRFCNFIGKYSLYIYLNHTLCRKIIAAKLPEASYSLKFILYVLLTFGVSVLVMKLVEVMQIRILPRLKKILFVC